MPVSTTQKQQGGACPYRFKSEEFVDYRCTTHYSINLAFDDQSPTKHEEIANCIKAGEATEGQLMVPLFLVESGVITMSIYKHYTNKHITVR